MQIKNVLRWLDDHILLVLASFLLAFIPLFPKLPLFNIIPGYIVRVRLEDFLVLLTMGVWGVQVLRKKIEWRTPLNLVIGLYAVVGILSTISAVLITKTVPAELLHIGKTLLHYFRYLEYFSLLFVVYSAIKTTKHLKIVLTVIVVTVLALSIYGYGQRYLYWPVYSTMNREFSKGLRLYLTEHARVQSTFGGHYDLAAYLVVISPVLLAAYYLLKNIWSKIGTAVVFLFSYWLLIVTASRTSYVGFFLAAAIVLCLVAYQAKKTWLSRLLWAFRNGLVFAAVTSFMLVSFGDSMYERLLQTLEAYPAAHKVYHGLNEKRKSLVSESWKLISGNNDINISNSFPTATPPANGISLADAEVLVSSDTLPTPVAPTVPSDVYVNVPVYETVATVSADGTVTEVVVEKERTYTDTAQKYGLSFAIRLDTLWPRALNGFYTNPLLGTGYATLTKESVGQFTEAESTDNNFLRTLGETGLLGFVTFYGAVVLAGYIAWQLYRKNVDDPLVKIFTIAFIGGTAGLLFNAIFIDVFAASKVAFTYWSFVGIILAIQRMYGAKKLVPSFLQPDWLNRVQLPQFDRSVSSASATSIPVAPKKGKKSKKFKNT